MSVLGFISLDCGLHPNESPYIEESTKLEYISDVGLVQGGRTGNLELKFGFRPSWTLRYFPDGVRNCYNIPVTRGTKYLIRAFFKYGNYDGQDAGPTFDLYLGPNMWATVDTTEHETQEEIVHLMKTNFLQVCLVKTGPSIPIINVLEIRPLKYDMYSAYGDSLRYIDRKCFSTGRSFLSNRYPDDVYDREWEFYLEPKNWNLLNTTLSLDTSDAANDIPKVLMMMASTPLNSSEPLTLPLNVGSHTTDLYIYIYISELEILGANDTREFDIYINEEYCYLSYTAPKYLSASSLECVTSEPVLCDTRKCSIEMRKTEKSTLPPLVTAIEVFTVVKFPQTGTDENVVAALKKIQSTYGLEKINWQGDPCLPQQFLWDGLKCNSTDNLTSPIITSLNLSSSGLRGIITSTFQNLTNLQELDLSNNELTGGVPGFLADMKSLLIINLSKNNLSGSIPKKLLEKKGLKLNLEGYPELCTTTGSCGAKKSEHKAYKIAVPILASTALVVVLIAVFTCLGRKKKKPSNNEKPTSSMLPMDGRSSESEIISKNKKFTYSEVLAMTNNFQRILGKGGFGVVYYGSINEIQEVAVKMLSQSSSQGYKQFKAEVELLLRVHHKNLVYLVGYCDEGENLALIYEYMANGDLDEHMSGKRGGSFLNWGARLKIVAESAQGLEYLHNGCKPPIVHRDIKTTNILLSENLQAKLADFGLSRSFPVGGETHVSTVVAGTIGYLDPEYYRTNWLTEKSDVYSFGIVILEIITNKPVIDQNREKKHIAEWVGQMLTKGDIKSITDPNLYGDYDSNSIWKALELAMSCLNPSSVTRPTMSQVVIELNECLASENSRRGQSQEMVSLSSIETSATFGTELKPVAR